MTVIVSLLKDPVTRRLPPPYQAVEVTLKRLRTPEWETARDRALSIVRDDAKLIGLLVDYDLLPGGSARRWKQMRDREPVEYAAFITGVSAWLTAVECCLAGIEKWSGVALEDGAPAPLDQSTLRALLLDDAISAALMDVLTQAARLVVTEGKPLGVSPNGSSAPAPTASTPTTAGAAIN